MKFWDFFGFFGFLGFISKLPRLLIKVTKVTTGHKKLPKIGQNSIMSLGRRPKPSAGARSRAVSSSIYNSIVRKVTNVTLSLLKKKIITYPINFFLK